MSVQYNKVTPIYQCIDSGNWKGAVKLCQRKDVEKWDITKSLMAYCLLQLNKNEQALEVALEVKVRLFKCFSLCWTKLCTFALWRLMNQRTKEP